MFYISKYLFNTLAENDIFQRAQEVNAEKLFVLRQRRLVWCPVYKVLNHTIELDLTSNLIHIVSESKSIL